MSAPKATRPPAGDKGTADRIEADDGAYWVRLITRQALDREGAAMGHCVGNGGYDNLVGGEEIWDDSIWSLRRADGTSILTVRVQDHDVDYARGPENHEPGRGASMQLSHLVAGYTARSPHPLLVDEDIGITLLMDGRTYRIDRLPADAAAARARSEAAQRFEQQTRRLRALERDYDRAVAAPVERVELCTTETLRRPVIQHVPALAPMHLAFDLTRREVDPVVQTWRNGEGLAQRFRTRSGLAFDVADAISRMPGGPNWADAFMAAYRSTIAQAGEPEPSVAEPRYRAPRRVTTLERIRRWPVGTRYVGEATYHGPWDRGVAYARGVIVADGGLPYVCMVGTTTPVRPSRADPRVWHLIDTAEIDALEARLSPGWPAVRQTLGDVADLAREFTILIRAA